MTYQCIKSEFGANLTYFCSVKNKQKKTNKLKTRNKEKGKNCNKKVAICFTLS